MANNYKDTPLTGKYPRKQEKTAVTALMIPVFEDERFDHGEEQFNKLYYSADPINDATKSGKQAGAVLYTDEHKIVIASGSKDTDHWFQVKFDPAATITPR